MPEGASVAAPRGSSPLGSTLRGASALFSTQPLTWASSLLITMFVPRFLGSEGLGQYSVVMAVASLAGVFALGGMPTFLTRSTAGHPERVREYFGSALVLALGSAATLGTLVMIVAPRLGIAAHPPQLLPIVLLSLLASVVLQIQSALLQGQERHHRFAWMNASSVALGAVSGVAVLALGGDVIAYAVAVIAASFFVAAVTLPKSGLALDLTSVRTSTMATLARGGLPFLGWNITLLVRGRLDILLSGILLSAQSAGWLAAAYRVISIPVFIPTLITTPLLPILSRVAEDRRTFEETLRKGAVVALLLTVPVSASIMALAPQIPSLLQWGADLGNASPLMMVLAFQQPLVAIDMVLGTGIIALGRMNSWTRMAAIAAAANGVLNLLLIPVFEHWFRFGALGATFVEVATECLMLVGAVTLLPKGTLDWATLRACVFIGLAGVGQILVTVLLLPWSLPAGILAGGIGFLAIVFALRVVNRRDLQHARTYLGGRLRARQARGSAA